MRRSLDTYRLPDDWNPVKGVTKGAVEQDLNAVAHLNKILLEIGQRLDTVQQTGGSKPVAPQNLTATGKQGCIWVTWNRVVGVDGYLLMVATESTMTKNVGRYNLPDSEQCAFQLPTGNSATKYYFQAYSYRGPQQSQPSPVANATSVAYGAGEAAPPNPPQDPRIPKDTADRTVRSLR